MRNALPSFFQCCRWAVARTYMAHWVIVEHMWNPLCTNFSFPQAVGEDMVNTYWRDSDL